MALPQRWPPCWTAGPLSTLRMSGVLLPCTGGRACRFISSHHETWALEPVVTLVHGLSYSCRVRHGSELRIPYRCMLKRHVRAVPTLCVLALLACRAVIGGSREAVVALAQVRGLQHIVVPIHPCAARSCC